MNEKAPVPPSSEGASTRHYGMVALIFLAFFVISLLTNVIGPLVPDIIKSFELSLTLVAVRSQGSERDVLWDMFGAILGAAALYYDALAK